MKPPAEKLVVRQNEASAFIANIADARTRLLTELALAKAFSLLAATPGYAEDLADHPFDALSFVQLASGFLDNQALLRRVLDGEITSVDDLDPFKMT